MQNSAHFAYDASLLRALIFASEDDKTRLRNSFSQVNLESHMLLNLQQQWTQEIDNTDIIRKMCDNKSTEMAIAAVTIDDLFVQLILWPTLNLFALWIAML